MRWQKSISKKLNIPIKEIPKGFQTIGEIAILNLPEKLLPNKTKIAKETMNLFPRIKTVCLNKSKISGEFRKPNICVLAGNGTETIHKENGCDYFLDVTTVMLSKGNTKERLRMKKVAGGVILDMFAGIGYFSIPCSKNKNTKIVHSIEKNPESYKFLVKNVEINKSNIQTYLGDCKDVLKSKKIIADNIIMGLLPTPESFLNIALDSIKDNGTIFYHTTHDVDKDLQNKIDLIESIINQKKFSLDSFKKNRIKKYGPRVEHLVLDLFLSSRS